MICKIRNKIKNIWIQHRRISTDFALNLISSVVLIGISQLLLYPTFSNLLNYNEYGKLLTYMGIANIITVSIGGSLNNTRLLVENFYKEQNSCGDFQIIVCCSLVVSLFLSYVIFCFHFGMGIETYTLILLYICLSIAKNYYSVEYRLTLNYVQILKNSIVSALGCALGLVTYQYISNPNLWPLVFMLGEFSGLLHILGSSKLIYEYFNVTFLFKSTIKKVIILFVTTISANLLIYLDRIILLPILGGAAVSTYTVASCFGKSFGLIMSPLAGVLLSHYSQSEFRFKRRQYVIQNTIFLIIGLFTLLCSVLFSDYFIAIFYPSFTDLVRPFVFIGNGVAIIITLCNMLQPSVLRYSPTVWQFIIQMGYGVSYFTLALIFIPTNGLTGFAYASLISGIVKYLMLFFCGYHYIR